eukprot:scaffold60224_cov15-Tisochrysis_lutea.AAC.1
MVLNQRANQALHEAALQTWESYCNRGFRTHRRPPFLFLIYIHHSTNPCLSQLLNPCPHLPVLASCQA